MSSDAAAQRRLRTGACVGLSLALHAAAFVGLSRLHPGHPFPEVHDPIPVVLLRAVPAPVVPEAKAEVLAPAPPPVARASSPPPPRPAPPRVAPEPSPAPVQEEVSLPVAPEAPDAQPAKLAPAAAPVVVAALPSEPAPAAPPDPNRVFSETQVDRRAAPLDPVAPRYPERARQRGRESSVLLELTIDASGDLQSLEIVESGGRAFDRAAERALRRIRFSPALVENRPVTSTLRYRLRFALR